jgi:hypothetical protein
MNKLHLLIDHCSIIWDNFLTQLGIWVTITSLISLVCSPLKYEGYSWLLFIVAISFSIVVAWSNFFYKKEKISISINNKTCIHVSYGDLFEKNGVIIIPVNDYFDTHVGDGIIAPSTIHGQFITKYFSDNIDLLDKEIDNALLGNVSFTSNLERTSSDLKTKRYPLGTCARIHYNDKVFILIAVTHFNDYNRAELNDSDYPIIIQKLYYYIEQYHEDNSVYVPLIGSGMAGINKSKMQLLNYMIAGAFYADHLCVVKGINVILYSSEAKTLPDVNLNIIKYQFRNYKTGMYND